MILETIFADNQGGGFISDTKEELLAAVQWNKNAVYFGNSLILADTETDLSGFFIRKVPFIGRDEKNQMFFYYGEHDGKHYWGTVLWLSSVRFYVQYNDKGGRDFNFVNGVWDFNRQRAKKQQNAQK